MKQYCIRGAITIKDNTKLEIRQNVIELIQTIMKKNNINIEDCCSIIFTATKDITAAYPAAFAREIGFNSCSLLCVQEMYVENSLDMCIRVMITVNRDADFVVHNIYLNEAKKLRPDLD